MLLSQLANFVTGLSLACGFLSVIFSLEGHFTFASLTIIIAVALDGLDGQIARLSKTSSEFGKEMDSLTDVISFGIAPSILGYSFIYRQFQLPAILALLFYLVCSVMRLAKFNITPKEKLVNYFYGLPTTASGAVLASFILLYRKYSQVPQPLIFLIIVVILSLFMISRVRYLNIDGILHILGKKIIPILFFVLILLVIKTQITLFSIFFGYLVFCPLFVKKFYS